MKRRFFYIAGLLGLAIMLPQFALAQDPLSMTAIRVGQDADG